MLYSDSLAWNVTFLARCRRQLAAHTIHGVCVGCPAPRARLLLGLERPERVPGKRCNFVRFFAAAGFLGLLEEVFVFEIISLIDFLTYQTNCQVSQSGFFYPSWCRRLSACTERFLIFFLSSFSYFRVHLNFRENIWPAPVRMFHICDDILECKLHTKEACLLPTGLQYCRNNSLSLSCVIWVCVTGDNWIQVRERTGFVCVKIERSYGNAKKPQARAFGVDLAVRVSQRLIENVTCVWHP